MIYNRLKQEEVRAKKLRAEVQQEQLRERTERPALTAYDEFVACLPKLAKDPNKRPDLRRAVRNVIERVTLDPRGANVTQPGRGKRGRYTPRAGTWTYEVQLRGASEPVTVVVYAKPEGWAFRSMRPAEYKRDGENLVG